MTRSTVARFASMRLHLMTPMIAAVGLVVLLSACTGPDAGTSPSDDSAASAEQTEQAGLATVRDAVPLVLRAVDGDRVRAEAGWTACMPQVSWQYDGAGVFKAPEDDVPHQLDAIRTALVEAGFTDVTQVQDQVAVERDGLTLVFSPHRATGDPEAWQFSFQSDCLTLSGDDKEHAESDARTPVDGLE